MQHFEPSDSAAGADQSLRPTLGLLPVLAISAAIAGPAQAQDTTVLDQVVIEGQQGGQAANEYKTDGSASPKVLVPLAEAPRTVKVITRREISERGATSVADILRTTPGITLGTGENGNSTGVMPIIRGSQSFNNVTVDGFTSALRTDYEAFNLETVEINKGADGATSGAGAAGGTINMASKAAILDQSFTDAGLTFGTGGLARATLDMNKSYGDLALRLNLMGQEADDFRGFDGMTSSRRGIAGSLSYRLTDQTTLTAGLYYFRDNDLENYGVPFSGPTTPAQFGRGTGTAADPFLPVDVPAGTYYGLTDRDFKDATTASAYAKIEHQFDNGLTWTTAIKAEDIERNVALTRPGTGTAAGVPTTGVYHRREGQGLSFHSQLNGEATFAGVDHTWAVGVELGRAETVGGGVVNYDPTSPVFDYLNPNVHAPWTGTYPAAITLTDVTVETRSIYAIDVIDLSPKLQLSLGLRFDDFDSSSLSRAPGSIEAFNSSQFWNGNAGLSYKLSERGMVYAAFGTSAEPAGESNGGGGLNNAGQDNLDPERSITAELGTKWQLFDDRLLLSAAIYQNKKTNDRVTDITGVVENIGETRTRGFELDLAGQITDRWGVSVGYAFTDAEIVDAGFTCTGTPAVCVPSTSNGTKVAGVPEHALSLWTTYAVSDKLTLGGGLFYTGKRPMTQTGTAQTALPSQVRVDLMASYALSESTAIQFNVNNVFDEQLYSGNRGNSFVNTDAGRNFTLSLTHSF